MTKSKDSITVFHFARWYPHRFDPMYGLFIQRHAEAAALYGQMGVVYAHAATENQEVNRQEIDYQLECDVHTVRIYYAPSKCKWAALRQLTNLMKFYKACFVGKKLLQNKIGRPDVIHIHILSRLGLIGLYYKWLHHTPYVISEHWSRYLPTGNYGGFLRKIFTRIVVRNSSGVTTVTNNLAKAMQQGRGLIGTNYEVLPNVVDPVFFKAPLVNKSDQKIKNLIHVSCFEDKSKNISGLLRAVTAIAKIRSDFKTVLVGEGQDLDRMKQYAKELQIPEKQLTFTGLLTGDSLVEQMNSADFLLVTSHYENLPVVIIESFVLGVPVISTRVGGIAEVIDSQNGVLVEPGNEKELILQITNCLDGKLSFDSNQIMKQSHNTYTPEAVGIRLRELYNKAIHA